MEYNVATVVLVIITALITVFSVEIIRRKAKFSTDLVLERESVWLDEIVSLRRKVEDQGSQIRQYEQRQAAYEKEIKDLRSQVEGLTVLYHKALAEITQRDPSTKGDDSSIHVPLLYISGPDRQIAALDKNSLRRSLVAFKRLENPTAYEISREMTRRRLDGTLYKWVHISSHMGESGISLDGVVLTPEALSEIMVGIELLFLAGCKSVSIADRIIGIVPVVISIREDVPNEVAGDFTYAFWREMVATDNIDHSYSKAVDDVPDIKEYVDIRRA